MGRKKRYDYSILDELRRDIYLEKCNHIAITGDLAHLSLPEEFKSVRKWLKRLSGKNNITLIPGNHDFYTFSGKRYYEKEWDKYMKSIRAYTIKHERFPFVRIFNNIAFVGLNSAVVTPPFFAYGFLGHSQLQGLKKIVNQIPDQYFIILLIHHPPVKGVASFNNSLIDMNKLTEIIKYSKIKLILHGHTHCFNISYINSNLGKIPVIGVPPAVSIEESKLAGYNIYYIKKSENNWEIKLKRKELSKVKRSFETKELHSITIPL